MKYADKIRSKAFFNKLGQAFGLLLAILFCVLLPGTAGAAGLSLTTPAQTQLTTLDGTEISSPYEMTIDQSLYMYYRYGSISGIDTFVQYALPDLPAGLKVSVDGTDEGNGITAIPLTFADGAALGTLRYNKTTGVMSLQFAAALEAINDFFLKLTIKMDEDVVSEGDEISFVFPQETGNKSYTITITGAPKDPPTIQKSGPVTGNNGTVSGFDAASNEITWTITVAQGTNPYSELQLRDTFSDNQEYVADSFLVNGSAPAEGSVVIDETNCLITYNLTEISADQSTTITYKTRIKNTAFLDAAGVPLQSGTVKCINTAQAYLPDSDTALGEPVQAEYNHDVIWLYKTSGQVINRATGEMEWTVTIYNNNLSMSNVMFYDRLSPGIVVMNAAATMQVGSAEVQNLTEFQRISDTDLLYNGDSDYAYNLQYELPGTINKVTVIKYRTIIKDPQKYNAAANPPPDTMYDNRAFITYKVNGGSYSGTVSSPVVEKESAYDAGLLGKTGTVENTDGGLDRAFHTITWTLKVNAPGETLTGVSIADALTRGGTTVSSPASHEVYEHVYTDLARNRPVFTYKGTSIALSPYAADDPDKPYTYRLLTDENQQVYNLVFYLGSLDAEGTLVYRSTVTDPDIYAVNYTSGTKYAFENKAVLTTTEGYAAFASAEVTYNSQVIDKGAGTNWYGQQIGAYDFNNNQFPWQIIINHNKMEMKDICLVDVLAEGTSLVPGSVRVGGNVGYYNLTEIIPEGTGESVKPYYTYNEQTRELRVYLPDITGTAVGTDAALRKIAFFVQVDITDKIFQNAAPDSPAWKINNTAVLYTAEQPDGVVSPKRTEGIKAQMTSKTGKAHKNNGEYSVDYTVDLNRLHVNLPDGTQVTDTLPTGLTLNLATVKLYEATVRSASGYGAENSVGDNEGGVFIKGAEVDPDLYQYSVATNADGTATFTLTLPDNSGTSPYILEYSCEVTDLAQAPFTNSIQIAGYTHFASSHTVQELDITGASGGGTIVSAEKTGVEIIKKNSVTKTVLSGAEFGLYYKGNLVTSGFTDVNGSLLFSELIVGREYEIRELTPPAGYRLAENCSQTFTAQKTDTPQLFTFENDPVTVPPTGVSTQLWLWLAMTAGLAGLMFVFMFRRRRRF